MCPPVKKRIDNNSTSLRCPHTIRGLPVLYVELTIVIEYHSLSFTLTCSKLSGGPLFEGDIEDYKGSYHVMCPWHAYMFDLSTGRSDIGLRVRHFTCVLFCFVSFWGRVNFW